MAPREYEPLSGVDTYADEDSQRVISSHDLSGYRYRDAPNEDGHGHEEISHTIRPPVYYGDGPFEVPSSESEDETLLEKGPDSPNAAERGLDEDEIGGRPGSKPYTHKVRSTVYRYLMTR